jgi:predicted nucleotidyltransferase component of viral defense system
VKEAMKLKAQVKKIAVEKNIPAQAVLQTVMFERLLKRISMSQYKDKVILKGGLLIAALVGLGNRTTMDMDATLRRFPFEEAAIIAAISEICAIDAEDATSFSFISAAAIRDDDEYGGFRIVLEAVYDTIKTPLKIDVTTGDAITPRAIVYKYHTIFDGSVLNICAYNPETVLAEKYETIIRRGKYNTRARDFYDMYMILRTKGDNINGDLLKRAIHATAKRRKSLEILNDSGNTIAQISESVEMRRQWEKYCEQFAYARGIEFDKIIDVILTVDALLKKTGDD